MASEVLPIISRTSDLDVAQAAVHAYQAKLDLEYDRRARLTPAQKLAERLNSMFSREPGEAWACEGNSWEAHEHKRWLDKADVLLRKFPDDHQRELVIKIARNMR